MTKTGNEILMDQVDVAINRVVSDESVEPEETLANLVLIIEKCEIWLDALRSIQ